MILEDLWNTTCCYNERSVERSVAIKFNLWGSWKHFPLSLQVILIFLFLKLHRTRVGNKWSQCASTCQISVATTEILRYSCTCPKGKQYSCLINHIIVISDRLCQRMNASKVCLDFKLIHAFNSLFCSFYSTKFWNCFDPNGMTLINLNNNLHYLAVAWSLSSVNLLQVQEGWFLN